MSENDPEDVVGRPNKSAGKRDDAELMVLAERLTTLPKSRIDSLPLDDTLREAVREHRRIRSHEAQRRHLRRLRKLLREQNLDELVPALERLDPSSPLAMQATALAQQWCERLLDDERQELTRLIEDYPQLNVQKVRQLLRKARQQRQADEGQSIPAAQRELLRLLREQIIQQL